VIDYPLLPGKEEIARRTKLNPVRVLARKKMNPVRVLEEIAKKTRMNPFRVLASNPRRNKAETSRNTHTHTDTQTRTHTHTDGWVGRCRCVYIDTHKFMYIHKLYTYIHTHTCIRTYIYAFAREHVCTRRARTPTHQHTKVLLSLPKP
jgi:hypothetical protein